MTNLGVFHDGRPVPVATDPFNDGRERTSPASGVNLSDPPQNHTFAILAVFPATDATSLLRKWRSRNKKHCI
jgi:hypothetical protein